MAGYRKLIVVWQFHCIVCAASDCINMVLFHSLLRYFAVLIQLLDITFMTQFMWSVSWRCWFGLRKSI